ncbi:MAG: methyltransferase domain-containing protein [Clostridiaceae bacterium]|nr:methyltransferase domain-containing protein [Clostridiaceae bacterium]
MNQIRPVPFIECYLKKFTSSSHVILDVGCGPALYRYSTSAKYIGLDVTDEPYNNSCLRDVDIVASASDIPLQDNYVDLILCKSTFHLIPDKQKTLAEFQRVLKPGGRILIADYNRKTLKKLEKQYINTNQLHAGVIECWTQWKLKRLIEKAGFIGCELLLPRAIELNKILKMIAIVYQEYRGTWAIVTGVKKT